MQKREPETNYHTHFRSPKSIKNFLTFRADKEIMEIVKNKASKLSISPTHFLIYLGLEANLEVKSTN